MLVQANFFCFSYLLIFIKYLRCLKSIELMFLLHIHLLFFFNRY